MRLLTTSVVFALALTAAATGQPPVAPPKTAEKKVPPPAPKADPTDAVIAAALANDADVKVAKAKIQLAEAELAKARQAVTLKVVTLRAKVDQHKTELGSAEQRYNLIGERMKAGVVPQAEWHDAHDKLVAVKASLALAEAELKLLTGGGATAAAPPDSAKTALAWFEATAAADADRQARLLLDYQAALVTLRERTATKGPIPDRIRAALDKPVKLGAKGEEVSFEKALAVFRKEAGLDVPVRPMPSPQPSIVSEGEELPVGAWFQLYQDSAAFTRPGFGFYVREYGLLAAVKQSAPPDAPTLTEFWKQKPPAKDTKPEGLQTK